ncbi:hypothetical protein [Georgenia muralis]|uniref:Uncharacterized protein n=1 Tax=Georgenia muralis TaxID=154117 RepID=A0A3N4ZL35_9MICO|nr:hypothetical protein [Georgenia muralis]RPF26478.1 hypothetical protein EDD32_0919 [Georgenia muralis]
MVLERGPGEVPPGYGRSQGRASAPAQVASLRRVTGSPTWGPRRAGTTAASSGWCGRATSRSCWSTASSSPTADGSPWDVDLDVLPGTERDRVSVRILPLHPRAEVWLPAEALDRAPVGPRRADATR